jgi:hypothetical protein
VYLDTEERRRFAQKSHEYLIEQVQHTGTDTVTGNGTKQVRLSYNHPVKELVWCFNDGSCHERSCGTLQPMRKHQMPLFSNQTHTIF